MDFATLLRPHRRWHQLIVRSQDGDLATSERVRLASHTATCSNCAERLADSLSVATLLRGLPEREAPRSFHITSAMVAASAREPLPVRTANRRPGFVLRGAQLVSGVAAAALLAVVVIDVSTDGGEEVEIQLLSATDSSNASSQGASAAPTVAAAGTAAAAARPSATAPVYDSGGGSASGGAPTAVPTELRDPSSNTTPPVRKSTAESAETSNRFASDDPEPDRLSKLKAELADKDGDNTLRILEIGLAAVLVAAIASLGWLGFRRRHSA